VRCCLSSGTEFIAAFFGCLYAGVIAVPLPSPNLAQPQKTLPKLSHHQRCAAFGGTLLRQRFSNTEALFAQAPELQKMCLLATDKIAGSRRMNGETLA
jgi:acyl-CoA synthetase (AMP-forming)/AMP-acid ligase II